MGSPAGTAEPGPATWALDRCRASASRRWILILGPKPGGCRGASGSPPIPGYTRSASSQTRSSGGGTSMLAYISVGIGVCNLALGLVFGLIWIDLNSHAKNGVELHEAFRKAARRLIGSIGLFIIPLISYFLSGVKRLPQVTEVYISLWEALCAVGLIMLVSSLIGILRYPKH